MKCAFFLRLGGLAFVGLVVFGFAALMHAQSAIVATGNISAEDTDPAMVARRFFLAQGPAERLTVTERQAKLPEARALLDETDSKEARRLVEKGGLYAEVFDLNTNQVTKRYYAD